MATDSPQEAVLDQLERERKALSEARLALENSKAEFDRQQQEQRRILEEERARLSQDQSQLSEIKHDLEEKRSQHEHLEREFKLRAQIEFQRFQEDKRNRRAEWERERGEIEARLREREEAFQLQEEQGLRSLREEKARLDHLAANLEKGSADRDTEILAQEVPLRKLQGELATIQDEITLREQQAAAAKLSTERARLDEDRDHLAKEAESVRKRVQEQEEAFRTTIIRKDEIATKEKARVEAQRSEIEQCMIALQQRTNAEREKLQNQVTAERERLAFEFERKLDCQKQQSGDVEARHAAEMEALRRAIAEQEANLGEKQDALAREQQRLAEIERISQIDPREFAANIAAEEARIENRRREIEVALEKLRRARLRRNLSIAAGVVIAAVAAGATGHYVKVRFIDIKDVHGKKRWEMLEKELADARSKKDWPALLRWCATTDKEFQKDDTMKPFYQTRRSEVRESVLESARQIISSPSMDRDQVLADLDYFAKSDPSAQLVLLDAQMRIKALLQKKAAADALGVYGSATGRFPDIAGKLSQELDRTLGMLEARVAERGDLPDSAGTLEWLDRIRSAAGPDGEKGRRITRLATRILTISQMRGGKPLNALEALTGLASDDAEFRGATGAEVDEVMLAIEKLPGPELLGASRKLERAGDLWGKAKPFVLLAQSSPAGQMQWDYYKRADVLGDVDARTHAGGYYLQTGRTYLQFGIEKNSEEIKSKAEETKRKGIEKLQNAAAAGSSEAMLLLGDAAELGELGEDRAGLMLHWAAKAAAAGRKEAGFLKGRALLRQAEAMLDSSPGEAKKRLEEAGQLLREAGAYKSEAWFFAALASNYSKDFAQAVNSLEEGRKAKDPAATYMLAMCYLHGQASVEQNPTLGRQLMIEAAKGGYPVAIEWCRKNPDPR